MSLPLLNATSTVKFKVVYRESISNHSIASANFVAHVRFIYCGVCIAIRLTRTTSNAHKVARGITVGDS